MLRAAQVTEGWKVSDKDGADAVANGSPEFRVWSAVPADGITKAGLEAVLPAAVVKSGTSQGMKLKWFTMDKARPMLSFSAPAMLSFSHPQRFPMAQR